jgi:hypothetical protein
MSGLWVRVNILCSILVIGMGVNSLFVVWRIVRLGGPRYVWEFLPNVLSIVFGIRLLRHWLKHWRD